MKKPVCEELIEPTRKVLDENPELAEEFKERSLYRRGTQEWKSIKDQLITAICEEEDIDLLSEPYAERHFMNVIEYCLHTNEDGVRLERGHPVVDEDGRRLVMKNLKSGNDTLHVACHELGREWAECGNGSSNKDEHFYATEEELGQDYLIRDDEVVGKICGNCRRAVQSGGDE